jgi:hypothetical protein
MYLVSGFPAPQIWEPLKADVTGFVAYLLLKYGSQCKPMYLKKNVAMYLGDGLPAPQTWKPM